MDPQAYQEDAAESYCAAEQLCISYAKTKQLLVNVEGFISSSTAAEHNIEKVNSFKYLGIDLFRDCTTRWKALRTQDNHGLQTIAVSQ